MASTSCWKFIPRGLKSDASREGLNDNLERLKKSNSHGSKYVLDSWALSIFRMENSFCSYCECSQIDRVYVRT